ncbi:sensor histidine kinase [Carboxylicivirga sp. N1Y90]|uniref:sensor histidine kinase n=1 Tax=Carboxylicivirga fragile TaxID=3417571 RepID=UPI003D33BE18|nr:hypothetical protein [Marinilabiliaceae bacterium N1Y90]
MAHMFKHKLEAIYQYLIPIHLGFKNRFLIKVILIGIFTCVLSTVFNYSIGLDNKLTIFTLLASFIFSYLYWLARYKNLAHQARRIFIVFMVITLNCVWMLNGGSKGPTLLVFQALFALGLFIIPSRIFLVSCITFVVNLSGLFVIEYLFPHLVIGYPSELDRIMDIYLITMLFMGVEIPLIYYANRNFQRERLKAEKSEQIKSAFLANMSHEIRTPMNVLLGFSEMLRDEDINRDEKNQYLDIIQKNGNLLLRILGNVLDLSKLETNLMTVNRSPIRIIALLDNLKLSYEKQAHHKGINLLVDEKCKEKDLTILSDENILFQVFSNLISNAIKFTNSGTITIGYSLNENGSKVTYFVQDTGIGISTETLPHIFDRFRQGDERLKRDYSGVGLGLTISKGLIELLGGKMWLKTLQGEGTTFYFTHDLELVHMTKKYKQLAHPAMN